ncbi:hypothetical protein MMC26_000605 [Xylographa opegraphella]|nr:hypothetical protein [Xylographa opegraphella]
MFFYNQWPIGLAVSSTGRIFVDYTRGTYEYTVGEVVNTTAEQAYPSQALQVPVSLLFNDTSGMNFATGNSSGFISVQALIITATTASRPETLWVLDTGRPNFLDGTTPYSFPGGPKLVAINLSNDAIYKTYTFPALVVYPVSYMNDVRIDLNPDISAEGVAYIVDSSNEGRNGVIILDLATGNSFRQLDNHPSTLNVYSFVPSYQGRPFYAIGPGAQQFGHLTGGIDGVQLSPAGDVLYFSPVTSDYLYSIETQYLRENTSPQSTQVCGNNVKNLGQRGGDANGFEGDSNGLIYMLMPGSNAIFMYDPQQAQTLPFVRDLRIIWPDSASVAEDGYIYVTINQLPYMPGLNNGTDLRTYPGAILRAKLPHNGSKIVSGQKSDTK